MISVNPINWLTRRLGMDRGRAIANATRHPARIAQDRHEQLQAIYRRVESSASIQGAKQDQLV